MRKHLVTAAWIVLFAFALLPISVVADSDCYICQTQGSGCLIHGSGVQAEEREPASSPYSKFRDPSLADVAYSWAKFLQPVLEPILYTISYTVNTVVDQTIKHVSVWDPTAAWLLGDGINR